jgi:hypothetical protein
VAKMNARSHSARAQGPFPVHRGPFLFGPEFLSSAGWSSSFQALLKQIIAQANLAGQVVCSSGDRLARIELKTVEIMVDGGSGMFAVNERGYWARPLDDLLLWSGPCGPPKHFFRQLDEPRNVTLLRIEYQNVYDLVHLLYRHMEMRFQLALQEGIAQITACLESPPSTSVQIPLQQWPYLEVDERDLPIDPYLTEDLDLDEAVTKNGRRIYCLGVVPVRGALGASAAGTKPDAAGDQTANGDRRIKWPREVYNPVIEACVVAEKKHRGKHATQAGVMRRATEEFQKVGLKVPPKSTLESRVNKIFKAN